MREAIKTAIESFDTSYISARMKTLFLQEANTMTQVYNFSAGPAMMPTAVLEKAQAELLNWQNQQTSVMEVSHRGKLFMEMINESIVDFRKQFATMADFHY